MTDPSCIFCRIIRGEIPCLKVFEDERALAFLDIGPLSEGHVLIVPKDHFERLEKMSAEEVSAVTRHLPALARAVMSATGSTAYNVLQNNGPAAQQSVGHVHFHIIPRQEGGSLGYCWPASKYPAGRAEELQKAIAGQL